MLLLRYLHLKVGLSSKFSIKIQSVLIADDLPKLGANLVATLSNLKVDDLSHLLKKFIWNVFFNT